MIHIISGESYQASRCLNDIKQKKISEGYEYYALDTAQCSDDVETLIANLVAAPSLFRRPKLIVIRLEEYDTVKAFFQDYRESEDALLVFFAPDQKLLTVKDEKIHVEHFTIPQGEKLRAFIQEEFSRRNVTATAQMFGELALIARNAKNLYPLVNEIEKITLAPNYYKELVVADSPQNPFAITDALARRDKAQALGLLEREFISGQKPIDILHRILWQLRVLLLVANYQLPTSPSQLFFEKLGGQDYKLNFHPFVIQKARQALRLFSLSELRNLYINAISLYDEILFSGLPGDFLLSQFFYQL